MYVYILRIMIKYPSYIINSIIFPNERHIRKAADTWWLMVIML